MKLTKKKMKEEALRLYGGLLLNTKGREQDFIIFKMWSLTTNEWSYKDIKKELEFVKGIA